MENIIKGFEGYTTNSNGEIFSKKVGRKIKLKKQIHKGYEFVSLMKDGKRYNKSVHRIVAIAFITKNNRLPCVDHIDGNKRNNNKKNLRFVTYKENAINASKLGLLKITNKKQIYEIDSTNKIIGEFDSCLDAERKTGISNELINRVCNNKRNFTHGRKFIFKENYKINLLHPL